MNTLTARSARWRRFIRNIELDFKVFVSMLFILCLFRVAFITYMHEYVGEAATYQDIWVFALLRIPY